MDHIMQNSKKEFLTKEFSITFAKLTSIYYARVTFDHKKNFWN